MAMLRSTIAACSLLAILSFPLCPVASVEVEVPLKSASTVRLTVLLDGKPQKDAKIEIYRYELGPGDEAKPRYSLISDQQGMVFSPKLAPGHYHVIASAANNLRAELYLDVSAHTHQKSSEFPMQLLRGGITREELFAKAEQMPIKDHLKIFQGTVRDPSGALIVGVFIEVVRKGSQSSETVVHLKSGSTGQFSATLPSGSYMALFSIPGFQVQLVPFEVTDQGSEELIVTLQLASTS